MRCYDYETENIIDLSNISLSKPSTEKNIQPRDDLQHSLTFIFNPTDDIYNDFNIVFSLDGIDEYVMRDKPHFNDIDKKAFPGFLHKITENMKDSDKKEMFSKIDYIIDLLGIGSGFLILFNIEGIPKFCITGRDVLSVEVRNNSFIKLKFKLKYKFQF